MHGRELIRYTDAETAQEINLSIMLVKASESTAEDDTLDLKSDRIN